MPLRRLTLLVVLAAVVASTAGCIVVPAPYPSRVCAPPGGDDRVSRPERGAVEHEAHVGH
jgi:hypothetical protein